MEEAQEPVLTKELAEFIGIMLGDGNIYVNENKHMWRIIITGHKTEDREYLTVHVAKLIKHIFNKDCKMFEYKDKNAIRITVFSRQIIETLQSFGLPIGRKTNLRISEKIYQCNNKGIQAALLRGIADTDFSISFGKKGEKNLYSYPILTTTFSDQQFAEDCKNFIVLFGIKVNLYKRNTRFDGKEFAQYQISIYGKKNLDAWMEKIGFNNEKHTTKIEIWWKQGHCPSHTTIFQRKELLNTLSEKSIKASK